MNPNTFAAQRDSDELLGVYGGAVSMCWEPRPSGVFASDEAVRLLEDAKQRLRELTGDTRGFVQDELIYLWGQLIDAYRSYLSTTWMGQATSDWRAGNDHWSGRCDGLATRIAAATALVGPVSPGDIQMPALVDGWFEWANRKIGITDPALPSEELLARCREYVDSQLKLL